MLLLLLFYANITRNDAYVEAGLVRVRSKCQLNERPILPLLSNVHVFSPELQLRVFFLALLFFANFAYFYSFSETT